MDRQQLIVSTIRLAGGRTLLVRNMYDTSSIRDIFDTFYNFPRALFPSAFENYAAVFLVTGHRQCKKCVPILVNVPYTLSDLGPNCLCPNRKIVYMYYELLLLLLLSFPCLASSLRSDHSYSINVNIYQYYNTSYG